MNTATETNQAPKHPWSFFIVPGEGEYVGKFSSWATLLIDGGDGDPQAMMTASNMADTPQAALEIAIREAVEGEGEFVATNPRIIKFKWADPQ